MHGDVNAAHGSRRLTISRDRDVQFAGGVTSGAPT
jgi:hypothetical protein